MGVSDGVGEGGIVVAVGEGSTCVSGIAVSVGEMGFSIAGAGISLEATSGVELRLQAVTTEPKTIIRKLVRKIILRILSFMVTPENGLITLAVSSMRAWSHLKKKEHSPFNITESGSDCIPKIGEF